MNKVPKIVKYIRNIYPDQLMECSLINENIKKVDLCKSNWKGFVFWLRKQAELHCDTNTRPRKLLLKMLTEVWSPSVAVSSVCFLMSASVESGYLRNAFDFCRWKTIENRWFDDVLHDKLSSCLFKYLQRDFALYNL